MSASSQRTQRHARSGAGALVAFVRALVERIRHAGIGRTAASLAFTTLIGIVPVFTVAFTYVAQFELFERFLASAEETLLHFFLPGSGTVVRQHLADFVQNAASLTGVNIVMVIITTMFLIAQIEREINDIWGLHGKRSVSRRAVLYVATVTAAPLSIGAAIYFSNELLRQSFGATDSYTRPIELGAAVLVLTALYALMPAQRVRPMHAFLSAMIAASVFELCRYGFLLYIRNVPTYRIVYGTLAVLPLFLIWIYLSWIVVLAGAAVTATLAHADRASPRGSRRAA